MIINHYSHLNTNAIELTTTAFNMGYNEAMNMLPLMKHLKTDSDDTAKEGILAWVVKLIDPLKHAMKNYPIHLLADHIQCYADTEKFMNAFEDKYHGQCKETFAKGPDYWIKIPEIRAKWQEGLSEEQNNAIMDALTELSYSTDRDPVQIREIKRALKKALEHEKCPQIVTSLYATGKTVSILTLAFSLTKIDDGARVLLAVLTKYEADRMKRELENRGLSVG